MSFRAVVIAGDKKSKIGIGTDMGKDVSQAIENATSRAKKNMINVVIVNGTIPHQVEAKVGLARILFKPQMRGRGSVAGGAVRAPCAEMTRESKEQMRADLEATGLPAKARAAGLQKRAA